jgi:hypothetical protein
MVGRGFLRDLQEIHNEIHLSIPREGDHRNDDSVAGDLFAGNGPEFVE